MATRATRSASRRVRLVEAVATGPLGALSHDELGVIFDGLADPLEPVVAVALSSTCLGLRTPLRAALEVLRQRFFLAKKLCRKFGCSSCAELRDAEKPSCGMQLTANDVATLGMILRWLPKLKSLAIYIQGGLSTLAAALRKHPTLTSLIIFGLGDEDVALLMANLSKNEFKALKAICFEKSTLSDAACAHVIASLDAGALPEIVTIELVDVSPAASKALTESVVRAVVRRKGLDPKHIPALMETWL